MRFDISKATILPGPGRVLVRKQVQLNAEILGPLVVGELFKTEQHEELEDATHIVYHPGHACKIAAGGDACRSVLLSHVVFILQEVLPPAAEKPKKDKDKK